MLWNIFRMDIFRMELMMKIVEKFLYRLHYIHSILEYSSIFSLMIKRDINLNNEPLLGNQYVNTNNFNAASWSVSVMKAWGIGSLEFRSEYGMQHRWKWKRWSFWMLNATPLVYIHCETFHLPKHILLLNNIRKKDNNKIEKSENFRNNTTD